MLYVKCRSCGGNLVIRQTQKKAAQLKKAYYYTAYYFCPTCQKIYHDDKFKIVNSKTSSLFNEKTDPAYLPVDIQGLESENIKYDAEIWTDGACVFNGRANARAAWAFVAHSTSSGHNAHSTGSGQALKKESAGLVPGEKQTNNVAEGLAILKALEWASQNNFKKVKVYTDSQISIHNLTKPAYLIKQNREIFQKIEDLLKQNNIIVHYEKVLGHSGDVNNEIADRLANELASTK